jgi:hypothetical protein
MTAQRNKSCNNTFRFRCQQGPQDPRIIKTVYLKKAKVDPEEGDRQKTKGDRYERIRLRTSSLQPQAFLRKDKIGTDHLPHRRLPAVLVSDHCR